MRTTIMITGTLHGECYRVPVIAVQRGALALHRFVSHVDGRTGESWVVSHVVSGRAVWSELDSDSGLGSLARVARLLRRLSDEINWCALLPDIDVAPSSRRRHVARMVKRITREVMS